MLLVHLLLLGIVALLGCEIAATLHLSHLHLLVLTSEVLVASSLLTEVTVLATGGRAGVAALVASRACRGILLLVFRTVCWPVDTIAEGLSTTAENGERPKKSVASEDLGPVLVCCDVVKRLVR